MNAHSFEVPDLIEFDTDVVATTEESASPLGRRQPLTPANDTKGLGMFGKARADDVSMVTRQRLHAITDSIQLMNLTEVSLQTSFVRAFSHRKRPATHAAPAGRKRIMN
ncbi:MAG: uncharacterized protein KVP18_004513 [Porospora cf. gigantea A]|nr:MAG: hypothetical protein KVP18_004513 [Porospora cf. gigantea A]